MLHLDTVSAATGECRHDVLLVLGGARTMLPARLSRTLTH